jgi:hypothetical protein
MKVEQLRFRNELADYTPNNDPVPDFLGHLQERLGVDDRSAAARLQFWLTTYEPGPAALAHSLAEG